MKVQGHEILCLVIIYIVIVKIYINIKEILATCGQEGIFI